MPVEKSAGAIIFRREKNQIKYLLLHYPSGSRTSKDYLDLPKGHIEKGENELDAAKREVEEETGLKDIEFTKDFKETIRYFFKAEGKTILKLVTFYLVKTNEKEVKISREHIGYKWLPYKEAIKQLTFKNAKEVLKKADKLLLKKSVRQLKN
ncbi:MAG: putative mutator protein MutT4 [Firmicutes bacterium]|nr:putative mutator protein MutT4 [Bacillota bacterium]